jgi:hypothetical protein
MVRDLFRVTGNVGIEVLTHVPLMYEGMDGMGQGVFDLPGAWIG